VDLLLFGFLGGSKSAAFCPAFSWSLLEPVSLSRQI